MSKAAARPERRRQKIFFIRGIRRSDDLRIIMGIGVFIAPILLYWEALSSESPDKARFSASRRLPDSGIPTAGTIRGPDEEGIFLDLQKLIAVGCPGGNPTVGVADIGVKERIA